MNSLKIQLGVLVMAVLESKGKHRMKTAVFVKRSCHVMMMRRRRRLFWEGSEVGVSKLK